MLNIDRHLLRQSWNSWTANDMVRVGPYWLQLVWTFLFSAALALPFTVLGFLAFTQGHDSWGSGQLWLTWYMKNLAVCLVIGYTIHGLFEAAVHLVGRDRIRRLQGWRRSLFFSGIPLLGVALGWPLGLAIVGIDPSRWLSEGFRRHMVVATVLISLLMSFLFHHFFALKTRQVEAERRATEAQLRLLQGQIEPHFLFNTLAGVISVIDDNPARAKHMLQAFTEYLRSTLATLRRGEGPLQQELDLAENYLLLMQARMEDRLQFSLHVEDTARAVRVPTLLLQPLVENAIQHGLEPQVAGGKVIIRARLAPPHLHIEVADDGRGLNAPTRQRRNQGIALANIRERLLARYGSAASLHLTSLAPGTLATVLIPLETQSPCPPP